MAAPAGDTQRFDTGDFAGFVVVVVSGASLFHKFEALFEMKELPELSANRQVYTKADQGYREGPAPEDANNFFKN